MERNPCEERRAKGASASPTAQLAPGTGPGPVHAPGGGGGGAGWATGSVGAGARGSARWTCCRQWGHGWTPKRSVSKGFWQKAQRASMGGELTPASGPRHRAEGGSRGEARAYSEASWTRKPICRTRAKATMARFFMVFLLVPSPTAGPAPYFKGHPAFCYPRPEWP